MLAKGYSLSKLFSKVELLPFEKEININLVYSSCVKHANETLLVDPRQSDQRTQSFQFPIVIHQSLDPAARSSAQLPKLLVFTCTSKFESSTGSERVDALGLRAYEVIICMITHNFSVISMTSQASLSLSLLILAKVTDAQYRKRFRASYNTFSHITFLGYNHMNSRASVFLDSLRSEHIIRYHMCPWGRLLPGYHTWFFLQRGCCSQGKEVVPVDHIRGKGLSSRLTSWSKIKLTSGFEPRPQGPAPSSLAAAHSPF